MARVNGKATMKKKATVLLVILLAAAAALGYAWQRIGQYADSPLTITQPALITVQPGTRRSELVAQFKRQQLVADVVWLPWLMRLQPQLARFKAGTYRLIPGMTVRQSLALLASGKEAQFPLRLVEGQKLRDWLVQLQQTPWLQHTLDTEPETLARALGVTDWRQLEGGFYPDTYYYTANTSDITLLKRARERMRKTVQTVWQSRDADLPYRTPQELVIMASVIEKETGRNDERARVASVFVNRLRLGMRLQTDPTVIYGLGDRYQGKLTRRDLETVTPYNTYQIDGLPPGAIAIPGLASLQAAAHPAKTDYLYFVADGTGGHTFSTNLQAHNQAVNHYRTVLKEKNER